MAPGIAGAQQCFPLTAAIRQASMDRALVEPVFLEEWSTCVGPSASGVTAVQRGAPGDATAAPVSPDQVDIDQALRLLGYVSESSGGVTESFLRELVEDYNGQTDEGFDYEVRAADDGWLIVPAGQPSIIETDVDVQASRSPTLGAAQRDVMDDLLALRDLWVGHPPPGEQLELPNTVSAANIPAWQALRQVHRPHEAVPMGWVFRVTPGAAAGGAPYASFNTIPCYGGPRRAPEP